MDLRLLILLSVSTAWATANRGSTLSAFDCTGRVSGICRSPAECTEEFDIRCKAGDGKCCPDPLRILTEEDFSFRGSVCSTRNCFKTYNGWWATACQGSTRAIFYCSTTMLYCCSSACRIRPRCVTLGGHCVTNPRKCNGIIYKRLCRGYKCYCCVPMITETSTTTTAAIATSASTITTQDMTTTSTTAPVTITSTTTASIPVTTTTTQDTTTTSAAPPAPVTTSATTTTIPVTTTTTEDTTTTSTAPPTTTTSTSPSSTTTTPPYTGPPLPTCPITGLPGVPCTGSPVCSGNLQYESICPYSNCPPITVQCLGEWTIILYRDKTPSATAVNFTRSWNEYKEGFGDFPSGEYWLGNEAIHALTTSGCFQMVMFGANSTGDFKTLQYDLFRVDSEITQYQLTVGGYNSHNSSGIDLFINPPSTNFILNGMKFSTYDRDNDNEDGSCSLKQSEGTGWWYNKCTAIKATRNRQVDWYFWYVGEVPPAQSFTQSLMHLLFMAIKPC